MIDCAFKLQEQAFTLRVDHRLGAARTAILGPSGAGKTTFLMALAGIKRPTAGQIHVGDQVWSDSDKRIYLPTHQRDIAIVFQDSRLFPHLTAFENMHFARGAKVTTLQIRQVIEALELDAFGHLMPRQLSGGQLKRVALARALVAGRRYLFLDEPYQGLNRELKGQIMDFVDLWCRDQVEQVLITTHLMGECSHISDEFMVINGLGPTFLGPLHELVQQESSLKQLMQIGIENSLACQVIANECDFIVAQLSATQLYVAGHAKVGEQVVLKFRAEDVVIAKEACSMTSAQNRLVAKITQIHQIDGRVLIHLDAGQPIYAEITPRALSQLRLERGDDVHCLIKSMVLRVA